MTSQTNTPSISRSALTIGGISLLLIAVLAGVGNFGALTPLLTSGDAVKTAASIDGAETQFRLGVLCMVFAAILDVVVAAALFNIFEQSNRTLALTAAWFRIAYAAVFLVALTQLASVPSLLSDPHAVLNAIGAYTMTWHVGLMFFAAHLLLVGYQAFDSGIVPRWLSVLVAIAGVGYLIDGVGVILVPDYVASISTFTFVGEVALIGWLLWTALRLPRHPLTVRGRDVQVQPLSASK